jgi:hypothetical protein
MYPPLFYLCRRESGQSGSPADIARTVMSPTDALMGSSTLPHIPSSSLHRPALRAQRVKLYWMRTSEAWPDDAWLENHFTCFDEDKPGRESDILWDTYIGNVHQIEIGPERGLWQF